MDVSGVICKGCVFIDYFVTCRWWVRNVGVTFGHWMVTVTVASLPKWYPRMSCSVFPNPLEISLNVVRKCIWKCDVANVCVLESILLMVD